MATLRKTVLATAMISTGLVSTAGMAMATEHGGDGGHGKTVQEGLVNVSGFAPNTTGDLCGNDVPVNAAGVQVPLQDLGLNLPILSKAGDSHGGGGNSSANTGSCSNPIAAHN
ncbi:hypothetical protein LQ327_18870 [Actinomycetospora endophytica]|uniref:Small secreted domain DUF320 n=1 Tax=Actinomycetospora endophytica TaxID=2291215 RepID=A0ABS8PB00_9PSEU|nr:hypothetical protein [Actinomycetospora endophytica]MCD2195437.1 hypothetical protein [Actinomycetospora endophytica]